MTAATTSTVPAAHHGRIGVLGAAGLVAGGMIGSGVYLLPATLAATGSIAILGWLAAAAAALAIAGVFIWLGRMVPDANGLASYVRSGLGRFFALQAAFAYWVSIWAGMVAVAVAAAGALGFLFPALADPTARLLVTLAAIWLGVAAAWAGPRTVARLEGLTLALGLLPVLLTATIGWIAFRPHIFIESWNPSDMAVGAAVTRSGLSCFWAFLGLECAAAAAGVVRDPVRNVPRATLLGVVGAAVLYIAASVVIMGLLPNHELAGSTAPFADATRAVVGAGAGGAIAICVFLRTMGCLTGWTLVLAETSRGAADDGDFPAVLRTRPGEHASAVNLLLGGALMTVVAVLSASPNLAQQFTIIANVVSLLALFTYVLAAGSLIRLAGGLRPAVRAGVTVTALLAIGASVVLALAASPLEIGLSLTSVAAGGLLYLWMRRR
ncbi:MAG: amino acid permease [Phenylobacterium sp.]|uniref:amino acid permease n=1 Tax=Phenylobacterium sp. TaxID=1871053 RepID=UPI002600A632|nr:amino acid permease [Phenylobacterium sp.]MBI1199836.1 amino acid permease [Phenylobacterium sp.]